jgi:transposase
MKRSSVSLNQKELEYLRSFKRSAKRSQREYDRANILLSLHKGKKDIEIVDFLEVERTTVWRTRKKYLEEGIERALGERARSGQPKKYTQKHEAEVVALACSDAPEGRSRWTLQLLSQRLKDREGLRTITRESVRLILKKTNVSLG